MAKPTAQEIAEALGIASSQIQALQKRGMPVNKVRKAREWFDENGFCSTFHSKSGGAASCGPSMKVTMKAALGSGLVVPRDPVELRFVKSSR